MFLPFSEKLPPKCEDPGMFTIPCQIGKLQIKNAMCDLGASINIMPLSIYSSLNVGPLKETGVILYLADRTVVYPEGVLEDVLVEVNGLVFPADFYVLDMKGEFSPNSAQILLGRPFLRTSSTKIDMHDGTITMEFDGEAIKFNIYDSMKSPCDVSCVFVVDVINPFDLSVDDRPDASLFGNPTLEGVKHVSVPKNRVKPPDRRKHAIVRKKGTPPLDGIT